MTSSSRCLQKTAQLLWRLELCSSLQNMVSGYELLAGARVAGWRLVLASKDTIENLFGSIVAADQPFQHRFTTEPEGVVEEVGFVYTNLNICQFDYCSIQRLYTNREQLKRESALKNKPFW